MNPWRAALCLALALGGPHTHADDAAVANAATESCPSLAAPPGVVFSAPPAWVESGTLPKYCRVRGTAAGHVQFEMRLPERWNGRFMMAGCGGFCGELLPDKPGHSNAINEALKRGYAAIAQDGGHQAKSWETGWASDPEVLELWAHKVLPVVARAGVALATSMYRRPPHHKYFSGCSNGGRLGLMAAQRYPDLFDGIAAGGSIFDLSGIAGLWGNWLITTNQPGATSLFPQSKVPLIERFVLDRCDRNDGLADGTIGDPRSCRVDFRQAVCAADASSPSGCLAAPEANVLDRLYGGVRNGKGEIVYPVLEPGSEHYGGIWLFASAEQPAWGVLASAGYRRMLAASLGEPDAPAGLPTDQMLDWIRRSPVPALTDAKDTDLSGLRKAGGRLLIYQGWSDPLIIPRPIVDYYERAAAAAGGRGQLEQNARLFMVPGWGHCWERPANAPDDFDPLLAVEQWVEQGRAPEFLVAKRMDKERGVERSRPICRYPSAARLVAGKDPGDYQSYECVSEAAAR